MQKQQIIEKIIYPAMEEIKSTANIDGLELKLDTVLFGQSSPLDSLNLVGLILLVEEKLLSEFNISVTLADERAMSRKNSPFRSPDSLAEYIIEIHQNEK